MFFKIILFAALSFVSARPKDQKIHHLTPEVLVKAQTFAVPCIEETNAEAGVLKKLLDGTLTEDESSKKFVYCFSRRGNFTDEEGHFNISRMLYLLGENPLSKQFQDTLIQCNNITKETPVETAYAMKIDGGNVINDIRATD